MPNYTVETLHNECWTLEVLPELGASILNLSAASGRAVMRRVELRAVQTSSQCASFTLLPYSNRIRDARFEFEGRAVQLRANTPAGTAQHGDVRNRPWQVRRLSATQLRADFHSQDFKDINWPWPFSASVEYHLTGPHLDMTLSLSNAGESDMPAGMGFHPYFTRLQDGQEPTLHAKVGAWYATDASLMPSAGAQAVPPKLDFHHPRLIGSAPVDAVFASWDGVATLTWPQRRLTLTADNVFSHVVLFSAPDGSFAIEPVSHATEAFNLAARGVAGTDMRVLSPGQTLAGTARLTLSGEW